MQATTPGSSPRASWLGLTLGLTLGLGACTDKSPPPGDTAADFEAAKVELASNQVAQVASSGEIFYLTEGRCPASLEELVAGEFIAKIRAGIRGTTAWCCAARASAS